MLGYRQSLKAEILELSDGGLSPDQVWRRLRCDRDYVHKVISRSAVCVRSDEIAANRLRTQTRKLGEAVIAAGGHR
jgi:hypothetical protein